MKNIYIWFKDLFRHISIIHIHYLLNQCLHIFEVWFPKPTFKSLGSISDLMMRFGGRVQKSSLQTRVLVNTYTHWNVAYSHLRFQNWNGLLLSSLSGDKLYFTTSTRRCFLKILKCLQTKCKYQSFRVKSILF